VADLWLSIDFQTRQNIKEALLQLLIKENLETIKYAAVCIAAIGAQEIPRGEWPEIIGNLCSQA